MCQIHGAKAKRHGSNTSPSVPSRVRLKVKHHQPHVLRVVPLPSTSTARSLNLYTLVSILGGVVREYIAREQIRMSIRVMIFDQSGTMLSKTHDHKLADNAAEVSRHQETFQTWQPSFVELSVEKPQKVHEIHHRLTHIFQPHAIRQISANVKCAWIYRLGETGFPFNIAGKQIHASFLTLPIIRSVYPISAPPLTGAHAARYNAANGWLAQPVRALPLQGRGRGFESLTTHSAPRSGGVLFCAPRVGQTCAERRASPFATSRPSALY